MRAKDTGRSSVGGTATVVGGSEGGGCETKTIKNEKTATKKPPHLFRNTHLTQPRNSGPRKLVCKVIGNKPGLRLLM